MRKMLLLLLVLVAAACSNGESPQSITTAGPTSEPDQATEECEDRTPAAPDKEDTLEDTKPEVEVPEGAPPCELVIQDIVEGSGAEAEEGATITVQYVGVFWDTGEEFDTSWDDPAPATFPLSNVIRGWQQGIPGMTEGGRRRLIIPPDLAYGAAGTEGIPPNQTLVFVIDLLEVETG